MVESADYLFEFVDDIPVGIARADTLGEFPNHFNKYFRTMFGWDPSEVNTLEKWFEKAYPEEVYREEVIALWEQMIDEAETTNSPYSRPVEVKVACKDGSNKWCEARYYRKGRYIYGIFVDINRRKTMEGRLEHLSLMDPLTEVHNRRYFNLQYYDRWHLSQRSQTPISIIMCDIDNFKQINDTHGHLVGDRVLVAIAQSIAATLKRATDFVARYGGEEFVIVSYDCDEECVLELATILRANVNRTVIEGNEGIAGVTMSFGVNTVVANDALTPEAFINQADTALYEAKKQGKDRVVVYKE